MKIKVKRKRGIQLMKKKQNVWNTPCWFGSTAPAFIALVVGYEEDELLALAVVIFISCCSGTCC